MEVKATHRDVRIPVQKTRLVADQTHGLSIERVPNVLTLSPKKAADIVKEVVESVIANAEHNEGVSIGELKVESIYIDKAMLFKHSTTHVKGRGNRIERQTCHITVTLGN